MTIRSLIPILALTLLLAGCGGDETAGPLGAGDHSAHGGGAPPPAATAEDPAAAAPGREIALEAQTYPAGVFEPLTTAVDSYGEIRELLVADTVDGLPPRAGRLATSLEMAWQAAPADSYVAGFLQEATAAARALAAATEVAPARAAFGEVSRFLIPVVGADSRLAGGRTVYACPMTGDGFNRWIGDEGEVENPFQGRDMLTCGDEAGWAVPAPASLEEVSTHAEVVHGDGEISHYTCSMHPSVKSPEPGICPICSMELTPVTKQEVATGVLFVDEGRRQTIGVKTAPVVTRPLVVDVRAVGKVVADETRRAEVTVKYEGWIGDLVVDETGQRVQRGQTLFTLYSPELYAAQQELLAAVASQRRARGSGAPDRADYLVDAAKRRLDLWDLTDRQIDRLIETGEPQRYIPIVSPVSGHVVVKNVVAGAAVRPGETLFEIAGLDRVWVEADVYESELALVEVGQPVTVTLPYLPGRRIAGTVAFVYPYLDGASRTGRLRIELDNPGLELKPDMYANVELTRDLGQTLVVPESAIVHAGPRRIVFLDLGGGRLKPQEVEVGPKTGDVYPVLSGLHPGDQVVTSGNFLIAAESRLKSALEVW